MTITLNIMLLFKFDYPYLKLVLDLFYETPNTHLSGLSLVQVVSVKDTTVNQLNEHRLILD